MLLRDKYIPSHLSNVWFHTNIITMLKNISYDKDLPHIIIHGPAGAGKDTIVNLLLEQLYGESIAACRTVLYQLTDGTSVAVKQSNNHIVINPNGVNTDRYLIHDIVKSYAQCGHTFNNYRSFRMIVINNADSLSYYAQMSLRRTMEKYSRNCRFVMICSALSKIIEPLHSRCMCIRIPAPTNTDIITTIMAISIQENFSISLQQLTYITDHADRRIGEAIWLLECIIRQISVTSSYDRAIKHIIHHINSCDVLCLNDVREIVYDLLISGHNGSKIIIDLMNTLCNETMSDGKRTFIITSACKYESRMQRGRKDIIHIEAFVVSQLCAS
jgi:replication factor C subunit 3/5